jgi:type IV pilus assembly protein PilC
MAKYAYEAKGANGRDLRGEIEATNEAEARVKLRAQRMIPLRLVIVNERARAGNKPKGTGLVLGGRRVKAKDMQIFTRQLATLLSSGIPILQAIDTLSQGARNPALSRALAAVSADISRGRRLGDAFGDHPHIFNRFYVNMVRAGEESGNLDQILLRLSSYIEKSVKLQGKVKGAMVYPAVIMVIAVLVVAALLIFVIPKFQALFGQFGSDLPALTKFVILLSDTFIAYWWAILAGMMGTAYAAATYYNTPAGKQTFDILIIDMPLMGELVKKDGVARFTRTLSTLLGSGVSIIEAMDIAAKTAGNFVIERAIIRAKDSITEGKSLTVPLSKEKYIPNMVTQMIGVGEQTGTLDQMLGRIADFYEDEVDVAVTALTTIIEPLMMVGLGGVIAFLVVAMYLPIFNLAGAVGN